MPAILDRTPTQVNAQALLREVQAAEEGVEAEGGTMLLSDLVFCVHLAAR